MKKVDVRQLQEFTKKNSASILIIAAIEEAQSVLNEKSQAAKSYRYWVKEGWKYDPGALLIKKKSEKKASSYERVLLVYKKHNEKFL